MVGDQIKAIGQNALDAEIEGNISEPSLELGIFLEFCSFGRKIKLPEQLILSGGLLKETWHTSLELQVIRWSGSHLLSVSVSGTQLSHLSISSPCIFLFSSLDQLPLPDSWFPPTPRF